MPQFNLTKLSGLELRQLLDASRARGDAAQSYQILQEMAARRSKHGLTGVGLFRAKPRPDEPRIIDLNLGDPLAPNDDFDDGVRVLRPEPAAAPEPVAELEPEPALTLEPRRPVRRRKVKPAPVASRPAVAARRAAAKPAAVAKRARAKQAPVDAQPFIEPEAPTSAAEPHPEPRSVWDVDPIPQLRAPPERSRAPRRFGPGLVAGFVLGAAAGATAGVVVGLGTVEMDTRRPAPVAPAPAAAPMLTATLAPAPAPPVAEPEPVADAALEATSTEPPVETAALSPETGEVAQDAQGEALELPAAKKPEVLKAEVVKPVEADSCAGERTPADRQICSDTHLQRLQKDLRRAYAEALKAHQDRATLRQRQLAWRDARDSVSDPVQLARLYEQRIRKLNAATAEARQLR